jgi:hypothetical protein
MPTFVDDLVLGRGRVYFDRFADGTTTKTGERFLGNCPQFQLAGNTTKLDHYGSTTGLKQKDKTVALQIDLSGTIQTDNMNLDNLSLWFQGTNSKVTFVGGAPLTDTIVGTLGGTYLQLGVTPAVPQGLRNVSAVSVKVGATTAVLGTDYELDAAKGRIYIIPGSTVIPDASTVTVTYTPGANNNNQVVSSGKQIMGALRFIADNPVGVNKDFYFPYVNLTSNGNLDLIADTWQTGSFSVDVLKLNSSTERVYATL